MAKNSNTTQISKKPTKNPTAKTKNEDLKFSPWLEDYMDCFAFKMKPVTEGFIDRLSLELDEWSKKESSIVLRDFYDEKNIPRDAFYRWAEKYEQLGLAAKAARGRIGSRREKNGLTRKFDPGMVSMSMPIYDPEWREFMQWRANLKQQEDNNQKVVIEISDLSRKEG